MDQLRRQTKQRAHAEALQLHREQVAKVNRPAMWRALKREIDAQLSRYKTLYSALPPAQIRYREEPSGDAFTVISPLYPYVELRAEFLEEREIEVRYQYRRTANADRIEWEQHITFPVDTSDNVYYEFKGEWIAEVDKIAKLLLTPAIDPHFSPPAVE